MEEKITEILQGYDIDFAYIFGSYVGKNFREESDIDIAVYGNITFENYCNLIDDLERVTQREIDLINLKKVDINFAFEIIATGKKIYIKDEEELERYIMYISSMYLTLEEDRKIVIDKIIERGSVYGEGSVK